MVVLQLVKKNLKAGRKNINLKNIIKFVVKLISCWISIFCLFVAFLYANAGYPKEIYYANAIKSLNILKEEGDYPKKLINNSFFQADNLTDATMVGASICRGDSLTQIERALLVPSYFYDRYSNKTMSETILLMNEELISPEYMYYGRYWHGYLVLLKPMLCFFDIEAIRWINIAIIFTLTIINSYLSYNRIGKVTGWVYFLLNIVIGVVVLPFSLQFFTCFLIMNIAILFLLLCPINFILKTKSMGIFFFILGALTVFFDLLTVPLITFMLPAGVYMLRRNIWPNLYSLLFIWIMWCLGYGGLWFSKWIFTDLVTDFKMLENALGSVAYRSSFMFYDSDKLTLNHMIFVKLFFIGMTIFIASLVLIRKIYPNNKMNLYYPLTLIAFLPIIWFFAFQNHSMKHFWFVWRLVIGMAFNICLFYFYSLKSRKNEEDRCGHSLL